ncbi:MAG: DUF456 domain-containing protein [Desulfobulbaceae bacterium]|jgi:uncharacterized protein YqgC (DUF456 family)|nr:DUF456 domain-containing protein [Desulfobulbaceae bacterium]
MNTDILLHVLAVVLILCGLGGIILPALPGMPLMFAGMLLSAWVGHFQAVSLTTIFLLAALTVIALIADFVAGALGAKRVGASTLAIVGATLGTVVGLFTAPLGLVFGPFAGAVIGEYLHQQNQNDGDSAHRQLSQATRVGVHTWIGLLIGIGVKVALAFVMLGIFIFAWIF